MAERRKITTAKKEATREDKLRRLGKNYSEYTGGEVSVKHAYLKFKIHQEEKGNSKQTLVFYDAFYKKFVKFINTYLQDTDENCPIDIMTQDGFQLLFIKSLGEDMSQQSINTYLRGYRAFGNYCESIGLLDGFKCPIKEVEPPIKQVYTDKELKRLLVKPDIRDFSDFRNFTIITLLLSTGARTNTLLNIRLKDVDLDEGYITFNTTKAHKVVRLGLEKKAKDTIAEYISYWRTGGDIEPTDFLFCNIYGEQLTRGGLSTAIERYNKSRGVEKTSIHLFRHTFAKNWITSGGDIISLAKVLTHSELDMVKHYSNLYGADVKAEIEQHSTLSHLRTSSGSTIGTKKRNEEQKKEQGTRYRTLSLVFIMQITGREQNQ